MFDVRKQERKGKRHRFIGRFWWNKRIFFFKKKYWFDWLIYLFIFVLLRHGTSSSHSLVSLFVIRGSYFSFLFLGNENFKTTSPWIKQNNTKATLTVKTTRTWGNDKSKNYGENNIIRRHKIKNKKIKEKEKERMTKSLKKNWQLLKKFPRKRQ